MNNKTHRDEIQDCSRGSGSLLIIISRNDRREKSENADRTVLEPITEAALSVSDERLTLTTVSRSELPSRSLRGVVYYFLPPTNLIKSVFPLPSLSSALFPFFCFFLSFFSEIFNTEMRSFRRKNLNSSVSRELVSSEHKSSECAKEAYKIQYNKLKKYGEIIFRSRNFYPRGTSIR